MKRNKIIFLAALAAFAAAGIAAAFFLRTAAAPGTGGKLSSENERTVSYAFTGKTKYDADGKSYRLEDTPDNEAEVLVAENLLCAVNGDFDREAQILGDTKYNRIDIESEKTGFQRGTSVQSYVIHRLSSLPEGRNTEEDREWVQSAEKEFGLTSFRVVTAVYTAQWPEGVIPQWGNGTYTREFLTGRTEKEPVEKLYDFGMPYDTAQP